MTGEVKYLSPRKDGALSFTITPELCDRYAEIEKTQFDGIDEAEIALTDGMFADHDELVDCRDEFEAHYPGKSKRYPGGHLPTFPQLKTHLMEYFR